MKLALTRHRDVRARYIADYYLGFTDLPYDLQLIVLAIAGMLRVGKRSMSFHIYHTPFFSGHYLKWQDTTLRGSNSFRRRTARTRKKE